MDSILISVKKLLGIPAECSDFDQDIIMHINSVFMILKQIGVGSDQGFCINDETTTWDDYLSDGVDLASVKTYMYMKVRMMFDPPQSSITRDAMTSMISELEFRINVEADQNGT